MSGHIHELRIHVPWTKLGSEPVVITINTMECILKLKDGAQVSHDTGVKNKLSLIPLQGEIVAAQIFLLLKYFILMPKLGFLVPFSLCFSKEYYNGPCFILDPKVL